MSQSWPRSILPYGITRPQWIKTRSSPRPTKSQEWRLKCPRWPIEFSLQHQIVNTLHLSTPPSNRGKHPQIIGVILHLFIICYGWLRNFPFLKTFPHNRSAIFGGMWPSWMPRCQQILRKLIHFNWCALTTTSRFPLFSFPYGHSGRLSTHHYPSEVSNSIYIDIEKSISIIDPNFHIDLYRIYR